MPKNKRILFAIMGWGLGHATRSIPLIRSLLNNHEVILASKGIALNLLRQDFPNLKCITFPDYAVRYPRNKDFLLPFICLQLPKIVFQLINILKL